MTQPLTQQEHILILDALVEHVQYLEDHKHPRKAAQCAEVYQKVGQALMGQNIKLSWRE